MGLRRDRVQKWKLAAEVGILAHQLDRPVCSADLRRHFKAHPDRYPLYLQRLGQVLIKIARERPRRAIVAMGTVGFYAYYAPSDAPAWRRKLDRYRLVLGMDRLRVLEFPVRVARLVDGPHERLARNALAGFLQEWEPVAADRAVQDWQHLAEFRRGLDLARDHAAAEFMGNPPDDLVAREVAGALLLDQYRRRVEEASSISLHRHLVRLVWPQSSLFKREGRKRFSRRQLLAYAAARWPLDLEEAEIASALALALRYGRV